MVAAVCIDLESLGMRGRRALGDLDDSKRLAAPVRERVAEAIMRHAEQVVVLVAGHATVDREGLHKTNLRLLGRALAMLTPCPRSAWWTASTSGPPRLRTGGSWEATIEAPRSPLPR